MYTDKCLVATGTDPRSLAQSTGITHRRHSPRLGIPHVIIIVFTTAQLSFLIMDKKILYVNELNGTLTDYIGIINIKLVLCNNRTNRS